MIIKLGNKINQKNRLIKLNIFYSVLESGGTMKTRKWKKLYGLKVSFVCPYCLRTIPLKEATKEHEPPKSRQKELGQKSQTYLVCAECNHKKGALTLEEYREWLRLERIRTGQPREKQK